MVEEKLSFLLYHHQKGASFPLQQIGQKGRVTQTEAQNREEKEREREMATSTAPIFSIPEQQHFGDYGFELDPHMDYFQNVIPKARRHTTTARNPTSSSSSSCSFPRFRFHKPISKDHHINKGKIKKKKRSAGPKSWWKTAIQFWKWVNEEKMKPEVRQLPRSVPAPLYVTESCYDSSRAPCRRKSGGLWRSASSLVVSEMGRGIEMPYLSLGVDDGVSCSPAVGGGPPAFPIYLVT